MISPPNVQEEKTMRRNHLRELLAAGKPTMGTHILSYWPTIVELIGATGLYDYVEFTAEYAPFTMHDLDNLGRAFEVADLGGMIKIEQTQYTHQSMRAIGAGFQSVLLPTSARSRMLRPRSVLFAPKARVTAGCSVWACAATSASCARAARPLTSRRSTTW